MVLYEQRRGTVETPKQGETFQVAEFNLTRSDRKVLKKLCENAFHEGRITLYDVFNNFSSLNNYSVLRKQFLYPKKEK